MPLKFRLRGLAETFVNSICCPKCGHDGGKEGDEGFLTDYTRVTYDGIIIVIQCENCHEIFIPQDQRFGVINHSQLRDAVENDSVKTGQPLFERLRDVQLDVERLNASSRQQVH
jgi:hypothetical protein